MFLVTCSGPPCEGGLHHRGYTDYSIFFLAAPLSMPLKLYFCVCSPGTFLSQHSAAISHTSSSMLHYTGGTPLTRSPCPDFPLDLISGTKYHLNLTTSPQSLARDGGWISGTGSACWPLGGALHSLPNRFWYIRGSMYEVLNTYQQC